MTSGRIRPAIERLRVNHLRLLELLRIHILPVEVPVESAPVAFICRKTSAADPGLTRLREALSAAPRRTQ